MVNLTFQCVIDYCLAFSIATKQIKFCFLACVWVLQKVNKQVEGKLRTKIREQKGCLTREVACLYLERDALSEKFKANSISIHCTTNTLLELLSALLEYLD